MATTVTTSLVVNFEAGDADAVLDAEIDDRDDGMNKGNTSFVAGDRVGYLIYKTSNVALQNQIASAGSLISRGTEVIAVEEFIAFANEKEVALPRPVYSGWTSPVWYGRNLGGVTVVNETTARIGTEGVGVCKVKYNTLAYKWELQSPSSLNSETTFDILIYVPGVVQ